MIRAEIVAGRSSITDPYTRLKDLTRGSRTSADALAAFVSALDISDGAKARLAALTPSTYTGLAAELVGHLRD